MKTLKLAHVAAYLPYEMNFVAQGESYELDGYPYRPKIFRMTGVFRDSNNENLLIGELEGDDCDFFFGDVGLLLRPLSDLTKEIEHNGESFVPIEELDKHHNFSVMRYYDIEKDPTRYPYTIVQALLSWHFDIYSLIPAGLAVDINTINHEG